MDAKVEGVLEWVEGQKEVALGLRNRGRFDKAIEKLEAVVERLRSLPSDLEVVQVTLSDALGQMGGVYDRKGDRDRALEMYRAGLAVEERHGQDTYNLGNVIRLGVTVRHEDPTSDAMVKRLGSLADELVVQTSGKEARRADEWWAWADLGQARLLQGDAAEARRCYENGRATGPSSSDYARSLEVLREIRDALPETAGFIRRVMSDEIDHLESEAP